MSFLDDCNCDEGSSSLGQPKCLSLAKRAARIIVMDVLDSSGNFNEVKLTDLVDGVLPASFFTTKFNADLPADRWNMTEVIKSPVPDRAEPFTEAIDDIPYPIRQGLATWTGMFYGPKAPPQYSRKLNSYGCGDKATMWVDVAGNLVGKMVKNDSDEWVLRPVVVEPGTWQATYRYDQVAERNKIMLKYIFSELERDADSNFLKKSEIGTNLLTFTGVQDVILTLSDISTTGATMTAELSYGTFNGIDAHTGLDETDLVGTNVTDDAAFTSFTATETAVDGTYTLVWDAEDAGDAIQVALDQDGYVAQPATGDIPT